jgi:hypothetical protein
LTPKGKPTHPTLRYTHLGRNTIATLNPHRTTNYHKHGATSIAMVNRTITSQLLNLWLLNLGRSKQIGAKTAFKTTRTKKGNSHIKQDFTKPLSSEQKKFSMVSRNTPHK